MKKLIPFIMLLILSTSSYANNLVIEDTINNRKIEADRYLNASPPKDILIDAVANISPQLPPDQRIFLQEKLLTNFDLNKVVLIIRQSLVAHFTAEELAALADFYSSPAGKSSMAKYGVFMADTIPQIEALVAESAKGIKMMKAEPLAK